MAKIQCRNGHIFDPDIYGNKCPLCALDVYDKPGASQQQCPDEIDVSGDTQVRLSSASPVAERSNISQTLIHRGGAQSSNRQTPNYERRLVGFLVTYNRNPQGKAFNLYEGRNYIGRDPSCQICVPDDKLMSGLHMSILYRSIDNKFKFRDEQSSNGTFVNKQMRDEGELENYDIIRAGGTIFLFIAIPKLS